MKQRLE
ncbi:D-tagatose-1,6-bisphosphate aldolase subunit KbaY, partial [Yersinia pestis PY-96]